MRPDGDASSTRSSDVSNGVAARKQTGSVNGQSPTHHTAASNGQSAPPRGQHSAYFGHDREEVTRILIQSLHDLGYPAAAETLSRESGYELESPAVAAFRNAILAGQWADAERVLADAVLSGDGPSGAEEGSRLTLAEDADKTEMLFCIRQQKFLECLVARDLSAALTVLRQELTPLNHNIAQLHALSSLLMCPAEYWQEQTGWDDVGSSRERLLSELSKFISPSVMIPKNRLAALLDQVKQHQINGCLYHNTAASPSLYGDHMCDRNNFPLYPSIQLTNHTNEIWYVEFSHDGTKLATASLDHTVIIHDVKQSFAVIHRLAEHEGPVTYVRWSPDDSKVVTCSLDKKAKVWDVESGQCLLTVKEHSEPVTAAAWAPDGESFVTASLDHKAQLCHWSLREQHALYMWPGGFRAADCVITPDGSRLLAADVTGNLHVYDFETHAEEYCLPMKSNITSLSVSSDSKHALISLGEGVIQLLDLDTTEVIRRFRGQKQGEYVIRSRFGGAGENFIVSGSEDSRVYIWHRGNGSLVEVLEGHTVGCVNAVSWNPTEPGMFASVGDDRIVRIWSPTPPAGDGAKRMPASSNGFTRTSALRSTTNR